MDLILKSMWFLLPVGVANLIPPVAAKLFPRWNTPVDFHVMYRGKRLFGPHKTIRGILFGVVFSTLTLEGQKLIASQEVGLQELFLDFAPYKTWWLGAYLGLCALGGDLIKSFLKRQLGIQPGRPWLPWDQVDWIIGTLIGTSWIFTFELKFITFAIFLGLALSFAAKVIGFWLGINKHWI